MFIKVEQEVAVRKYPVDEQGLMACLKSHKGNKTIGEIAHTLGCPKTEVEHWFRQDKYFSIPNADIWLKLKDLLGIETDRFDKSILEYEFRGGSYDMSNRIHVGETAPTLTTDSSNIYFLVEK